MTSEKKPFFSVVIPLYNKQKYVHKRFILQHDPFGFLLTVYWFFLEADKLTISRFIKTFVKIKH